MTNTAEKQTEYDILVIVQPNLEQAEYDSLCETFQSHITSKGGQIDLFNPTGLQDLAQTFLGYEKGFYFHCQFTGDNRVIDELQEQIKVNEHIVRHLLVLRSSIELKKKDPVSA